MDLLKVIYLFAPNEFDNIWGILFFCNPTPKIECKIISFLKVNSNNVQVIINLFYISQVTRIEKIEYNERNPGSFVYNITIWPQFHPHVLVVDVQEYKWIPIALEGKIIK